jgi:hypothetical protein
MPREPSKINAWERSAIPERAVRACDAQLFEQSRHARVQVR